MIQPPDTFLTTEVHGQTDIDISAVFEWVNMTQVLKSTGYKKKQNQKNHAWQKQVPWCVPLAPGSSFCRHGQLLIVAKGKPNPLKCMGKFPWAVILLMSLEILLYMCFSVPRDHVPTVGLEGCLVLQTFSLCFLTLFQSKSLLPCTLTGNWRLQIFC